MKNNFEYTYNGIKCDNVECDYKNEDVQVEEYKDWLNKLCPKCGENLLTQKDYENAVRLHSIMKVLGNMEESEFETLMSMVDPEKVKQMEAFKDIDWNNVDEKDMMEIKFNTHKEISIKEAKIIKKEEKL